ncbi:peptidase S8, partial [Scytonema sp. UIC 10036]|uniref:pre-peptidase C-terminal domain-containing protein n=1 Tax=Scytonema sp. UIC 10036 TaxID=2304196 RepID=UPI0013857A83
MTIDGAGNTLLSAREFNITPTTQTFTDWVGSSDLDDFYRFSLSNSSSFNLALNGLVADADVQLIRDANSNGIIDSGEVIASSTNGSTTAESISRTLDAGTYYTRVYPFNGANTNYNLSVFATINDFAGNNLNSARQINLDSVASTYSDWVGSSDTDDYYRFSLGTKSSFNLALNGLVADADVQLIRDANSNGIIDSGEVIASSTNGSTTAESISR